MWQPDMWQRYCLFLLYSLYFSFAIIGHGLKGDALVCVAFCSIACGNVHTHTHKGLMRSKVKLPAQPCTWRKMAGLWLLQNTKGLLQIFPYSTSNGLQTHPAQDLLSKPSKAHHNFFFPLPPSFHFTSIGFFLGCQNCWTINKSWKRTRVPSKSFSPLNKKEVDGLKNDTPLLNLLLAVSVSLKP